MSFPTFPGKRMNRATDPRNTQPPNLKLDPMKFIWLKLQEPSTIRGLIALLAGFGITIAPQYHDAIIATFLGLIGIINVYRSEVPKATIVEDEGGAQ
jgi:hypothetical protein